jgi:hypothetical protein
LWLRLTTEGTDAWYSAEIDAPARIAMPTGGMQRVTLTVKNDGRVTWDSHAAQPFRLSYHWLTADGMRVVSWEGRRTLFPHPVPPGSELTLVAEIGAPRQPGEYRVLWDIEHEHRLWFSTEPGAEPAVSVAHVSGQALGALPPLTPLPRPLQDGAFRPGRRALWSAAARMIRERPLTGIGPDNFRLRYGPYLRIADADARLHSNNMYIEVLAGTGLLGGAALAYFTWRVGVTAFRALGSIRRRRDEWPEDAIGRSLLVSGVAAGVTAIAVHGLVDSFLSFTATYVLIAVALGLLASLEFLSRPHADRL